MPLLCWHHAGTHYQWTLSNGQIVASWGVSAHILFGIWEKQSRPPCGHVIKTTTRGPYDPLIAPALGPLIHLRGNGWNKISDAWVEPLVRLIFNIHFTCNVWHSAPDHRWAMEYETWYFSLVTWVPLNNVYSLLQALLIYNPTQTHMGNKTARHWSVEICARRMQKTQHLH